MAQNVRTCLWLVWVRNILIPNPEGVSKCDLGGYSCDSWFPQKIICHKIVCVNLRDLWFEKIGVSGVGRLFFLFGRFLVVLQAYFYVGDEGF